MQLFKMVDGKYPKERPKNVPMAHTSGCYLNAPLTETDFTIFNKDFELSMSREEALRFAKYVIMIQKQIDDKADAPGGI
jgi:hypothetical protein